MIEQLADLVLETGKRIMNEYSTEGAWDGSQFKANADQLAHHHLATSLRAMAPSLPILSEEDPASIMGDRPDVYWLIDPIDGTASFVHGFSGYVTQIALVENGEPVLAAIYAPKLDQLYLAAKGEGAFCNGNKLQVPIKEEVESIIDNTPQPQGFAKEVYDYFSCKKYVECGSLSLKSCKVAEGVVDLFVKNVVVRDWDVAAPQLIVEEAGGLLTDLEGRRIPYKGSFERNGVIVCQTKRTVEKLAAWYQNRERGDVQP